MDWADDVAYSVHDVEDGVHGGLIKLGRRSTTRPASGCATIAADAVLARGRRPSSRRCSTRCSTLPTLRDLAGYDGTSVRAGRGQARDQRAGRPAVAGGGDHATRAEYGAGPLGRYAADPGRARPGSPPSARCSRRSPRTT